MIDDIYERTIREFGAELGLPDMSFNEDDICHITINDAQPVAIRRDYSAGRLILLGKIAERLSPDLSRETLEEYLASGLNSLEEGGCSIGVEPVSGMVMLHTSVFVSRLNSAYFEAAFGDFLEKLLNLSERNAAQ